jgi:hypothetical protein
MEKLENRVAVITGIGLAMAKLSVQPQRLHP